jgi:hypothetical protein
MEVELEVEVEVEDAQEYHTCQSGFAVLKMDGDEWGVFSPLTLSHALCLLACLLARSCLVQPPALAH